MRECPAFIQTCDEYGFSILAFCTAERLFTGEMRMHEGWRPFVHPATMNAVFNYQKT
jgi:hypothetical protein